MLSAAKVKIHGMQDDNWVIKDKINQYRNLNKLYERDRKIHEGDLNKQKRRYFRDIRRLRQDINIKRGELSEYVFGDKQFIRNAFQEHRRLQLTYLNCAPDKVLDSILQENFNRRKQLDLIRYAKLQKMEAFRQMQLESAELRDRMLYETGGNLPAEKKEQTVANYVQKANIKKNAALAIKVMYIKILDILKKDSSYFSSVLEALKLDCRSQGKCLMGATEMGQLAMEYLDDRKFEYNKLEKEIKANMKERERTLKLARKEVTYLTNSFPRLIRKEEAANLDDLYDDENDGRSTYSLHWELEELMNVCRRLQKATLVSAYDEILPRLKEQKFQKERLMTQLLLNQTKRSHLVEDVKHANLMLDSLKNLGQDRTAAFVAEKTSLRAQLAAEKTEIENLKLALDTKGRLIIEMKTSLQQINEILSRVAVPNVPRPVNVPTAAQYTLDDYIQPKPKMDSDFDVLISTAKSKLNVLLGAVAKLELTPELRKTSFQFYHGIIARMMRDQYKDEVAAEGGLIEFEMEDPNVPSHAVVKLRSKQLCDAQVSEFDAPKQ